MESKCKGKIVANICCLGVDYVGVPLCIVIAHMCPALKVAIVDLDANRISIWNTRQIPSQEPGLEEMLKKCQNKNLLFTSDTEGAIKAADLIFISMNTPIQSRDKYYGKTCNLTNIEAAARLIARTANNSKIIVEKSTVPVGSNEIIKRILQANKNEKVNFQVLSNPEFYPAGTAIKSLMDPERVLIGSDMTSEALSAAESLASIYSQWVPRDKIITMSAWSSELTKLSLNAFLAQRLSSVNSLSMLCEASGGNINEVVKILGETSAIGKEYLEPSLGFGGGYLKKDLLCLIYMCERFNLLEVADYWKQVIVINELQKKKFKQKILKVFFNTMSHKKIAIWGFSYKKDVELTADSPAIYICKQLLDEGARVNIYDPEVEKRQILDELQKVCREKDYENNVTICEDPYKAAYKSHAVICCTDWDEFKSLNFGSIFKEMMKPAYIFDGRMCLPHEELATLGFVVNTIGKKLEESGLYSSNF